MALGTWSGWAGDPQTWPVTPAGRRALDWALSIHEDFYSSAWLTQAMLHRPHPLMSLHEWPLSQPRTVPRLLERAARIAILDEPVRMFLQVEIRGQFTVGDFDHLDLLWETAGLSLRAGGSAEADVLLPSGKRPDLRLVTDQSECCFEVTRMEMDRHISRKDKAVAGVRVTWRFEARPTRDRVVNRLRISKPGTDQDAFQVEGSDCFPKKIETLKHAFLHG